MPLLPDSNLCRVCKRIDGEFIKLDSLLFNGTSVINAFNELTNLQAALDDPLPQLICQICIDDLECAREFLHKAEKSDQNFRKLIEADKVSYVDPLENKNLSNEEVMDEIGQEEYMDIDFGEETIQVYALDINVSESFLNHIEITAKPVTETSDFEVLSVIYENQNSPNVLTENDKSEDTLYDDDFNAEEQLTLDNDVGEKEDVSDDNDVKETEQQEKPHCLKNAFECKICNKKYKTEIRQKMHELIEHRTSDTICPFCQKEYSPLHRLRAHILNIHIGRRAFDCDICGVTLTKATQLRIHKLVHTGERPHICEWCGESFSQKSVLNTHRVLHTGKTIKCEICAKMFCRSSELRVHMKVHTGERPYKCDQCESSYINKYQLTVHLGSHIGFKCEICGKVYTRKNMLRMHIDQDHGDKPQVLNCDECRRTFNRKKSYRNHMRTKHNVYKNAAAADKQLIKETGEEEN